MNFSHRFLCKKKDKNDVILFCEECKILNYTNNSSLKLMKYDTAEWVGTYYDNLLISISGVRPEPAIDKNAYRIMFRGCTLPGYSKTISKDITKTSLNWDHIKLQIDSIKDPNANFFMTSNTVGGSKSHRLSKYMWNCREVEYYKTMILFNVEQIVWQYIK